MTEHTMGLCDRNGCDKNATSQTFIPPDNINGIDALTEWMNSGAEWESAERLCKAHIEPILNGPDVF